MAAGLIGVPLGSVMAQRLKVRYPNADPLICAGGLLISAPLLFLGLALADKYYYLVLVLIFFGQVSLNLNWSIVADILLVSTFKYIKQYYNVKKYMMMISNN